jgi:Ca2+-binding RTX toxin-like protein
MRVGLVLMGMLAAAALVFAATATSGPSRTTSRAFIGPYTGVATGERDGFHHKDNGSTDPKSHIVSDSTDEYHGRFTYSFRIDNGVVKGTGNGDYQSATWHLQGTNGDNGAFNCDIPVTTQAFSVRITGYAAGGSIYLQFHLNDDAVEKNDEYDCGADYKGFASTTHYLQESLDKAQEAKAGGVIVTDQHHPAIGHLGYNDVGGPDNDHFVRTGEWDITITPPSNTGSPSSGGPGPGGSKSKNPSTKVCKIQGTARRDVLVGTAGDDVICGFGGNDVIKGMGGNDLIYGGPGNDSINGGSGLDSLFGDDGKDSFNAKDGARDTVIGGPGKDSAKIDKGKDKTKSVERVS